MAILFVLTRHWDQFLALFGFGAETARFGLSGKAEPLPTAYVISIMAATLLFEVIPYAEELVRGLKAHHGMLVPPKRVSGINSRQ